VHGQASRPYNKTGTQLLRSNCSTTSSAATTDAAKYGISSAKKSSSRFFRGCFKTSELLTPRSFLDVSVATTPDGTQEICHRVYRFLGASVKMNKCVLPLVEFSGMITEPLLRLNVPNMNCSTAKSVKFLMSQ